MPLDVPVGSGIYRITCLTTGKFYIGSTANLHKRLYEHFRTLRLMTHSNRKLQNAWNKYGEQAFTVEVIEWVLPPFLLEREQYWIDALKPSLNIAPFAQSAHLGVKHSPESIAKMRAVKLGKPAPNKGGTHTTEARAKMSAAKRGKPAHNRGKKHSPETIEKLRIAKTGRKASEEVKRKMSESMKGKKHTVEAIEKMRIAATGRTASEEARRKMRSAKLGRKLDPKAYETRMKTYIVTAPDGTEYVVHGLKKFCDAHHLNYPHLIQVAKGKKPYSQGWQARYAL